MAIICLSGQNDVIINKEKYMDNSCLNNSNYKHIGFTYVYLGSIIIFIF